jgi:hypothetical protein
VLGALGEATIVTRKGKVEQFLIEDGDVVPRGKSSTNFLRGTNEELPTVGDFRPLGNTSPALKTSGDFICGEGSTPSAWQSPQIAVFKGSFKGKAAIGMMLECGSKVRLECQRGQAVEGIKINLSNVSVLEASLAKRLSKMSGVEEKMASPGSESPDGFIAI